MIGQQGPIDGLREMSRQLHDLAADGGPLEDVDAAMARLVADEIMERNGELWAFRSDVVREVGSWFAHGYTLDLRRDGTGTFSVWLGAFDGDRVQLRLIPAPGPATVAEVIAVETVGDGALGPDARPGIGGLVTILFGEEITTAHVEWTSGPDRHAVDLCPAVGLDVASMNALHCGA